MLSAIDIKHISDLARLESSAEELQSLESDLIEILRYISVLDEVVCEDSSAPGHEASVLREDRPQESLPLHQFLDNAPETLDRFLIVPSIK